MSTIITYPTHSLTLQFPQGAPPPICDRFTALRNEPVSFQVAYTTEEPRVSFYLRIRSDLPIALYSEGYAAVTTTENPDLSEHYEPGLFPDLLLRRRVNPPLAKIHPPANGQTYEQGGSIMLFASRDATKALWLTVNEDGKNLKAGEYPVTVEFYNFQDELIGSQTVTIRLLAATLPRQTLYYTNWFHCDCLADTYEVPLWSEEFYRIFRHYVKEATRHGMNMILTPAFTPALDTPIGTERKTAQLVDITVTDGVYSFDFSKLKRFMDEARACGIQYFEHAALFTQWGAKHAPKIMATVDGKYRRIFGWETKASGKKYTAFLDAYLPAVRAFLREEGLEQKMMFHISDEPEYTDLDAYRAANAIAMKHLEGCMVGDPLSSYKLYSEVGMGIPITTTRSGFLFTGRVKNVWCYYTGALVKDGESNRLIFNSPERNRVIGVQMYMTRMKGFLQWAYNFYYGTMCQGLFDPTVTPDASSSCYMVYPALNGTAIPSMRMKVFYEAINDMRALQRLERLRGRKFTEALVRSFYGDVTLTTHVESADKLLALRAAVNDAIEQAL